MMQRVVMPRTTDEMEKVVEAVRQRVGCFDGIDITPAQVRSVMKQWLIESKEYKPPVFVEDRPTDFSMSQGAIVRPISAAESLRSGGAEYGAAIVLSVDPFVLVSEEGDMRWGLKEAKNFAVVSRVTPHGLSQVIHRLYE